MSETNVTRRGFFGHAAGAYTLVAGATVGAVVLDDPMLDAARHYRAVSDEYTRMIMFGDDDDAAEAFRISAVEPVRARIQKGVSIATPEGCRMAIETALMDRPRFDDFERALLMSALTFLQTQPA